MGRAVRVARRRLGVRREESAVKTIRELREERDWTQLELAYKLKVTPATVSNWERGIYEPKASQLRAIARLFGVSMDDIALVGDEKLAARAA